MRWLETQARSPGNEPNRPPIPAHIKTCTAVTVVAEFNDRARKGHLNGWDRGLGKGLGPC